MNDRTRNAIIRHGEQLQAIFPKVKEMDPLTLCRKVRKLELEAERHAEDLCNYGPGQGGYEEADRKDDSILARLDKILGFTDQKIKVFVNRDPRGYALKIDYSPEPIEIYRDMGGYGIIAPDLTM